ncbi:MAG: SRPBCC family protein [Ilumatobacter sp.]|jgi:hypothetical protein|uniref:SRPBCC family protein n=1 Tax=Ilumatobacter sp. TaxID=1967498 RepID=UPI00391919B1
MPRNVVQPPEWIDSAPILVEREIVIDATPAEVWSRIADHEHWPDWFTSLDTVEVTGRPTGVGGGRTVTVKRISIVEEFTAWDDDEHFAFAVTSSPIPMLRTLAESVRLVPEGDGCRIVYRQGLSGRRFLGWAMSLAWKQAAKQLEVALSNLKAQVEASKG